MDIGSHHKSKDTFIVFKEKETLSKVCCSAAITKTFTHNPLVGTMEQLFSRTQ